MELLQEFPLNAAYLLVEDYQDLNFDVDLEALLQENIRVGRGLGVSKEEIVYSLVKARLIYHWNPFKTIEYSYRI